MKNSFKSLLLISVFAFGLSACGDDDNSSSKQQDNNTDTAQTSAVDQVFTYGLSTQIKTLDVSKATDLYSRIIFNQTLEGLTAIDLDKNGNTKPIPGIAKSWETTADGLEWTFHLRDSQWNDGQPVVAEDFKYSLLRTLDPQTAASYAFNYASIKNALAYNAGKTTADKVGIQVIDDHTIKFTLENPTGYFLSVLAKAYPQRKDIVEKNGTKNGSSLETSNMGNGPFKLTEWVPSSKLTLVKNEKYWNAKNVKLEKIKIPVILETTAHNDMLYNGQLDTAPISTSEWDKKLTATGKFNRVQGYNGAEIYGVFNMTNKLFTNLKVRQAFSLAVTREDLVKVVYNNKMQPAYGWTGPKIMIGTQEYRSVSPEPLKELKANNPDPKALLIQGLKELGLDPDPTHLTVTYLNSGTTADHHKSFAYFQQMWHTTLGVNVKGEFVQWPVFLSRIHSRDFQLATIGEIAKFYDPSTFFDMWSSKAGMYSTGFKSAEYDTLIENARKEIDPDKRLKIFQRAEKILVNEQTAIFPIGYLKGVTFSNKKVHGLKFGHRSFKDIYITK